LPVCPQGGGGSKRKMAILRLEVQRINVTQSLFIYLLSGPASLTSRYVFNIDDIDAHA